MKISKEIKVGFVALAAILVFVFGFNYLKGINPFSTSKQYYAVYSHVDGLGMDNSVQLNGVRIGRVNSIELMHDMSGRILVGFSVDNEFVTVSKNSTALIKSTDLFGTMAIILKPGDSPVIAAPGDTLSSDIEGDLKEEIDNRLRPLEKKTNDLIASVDSVVTIVQTILNEDARTNLVQGFESINKSFQTFNEIMNKANGVFDREEQKIGELTSSMNSIFNNIEKNNQQITTILNNFAVVSDSLVKSDIINTVANAGRAMENVATMMEKINTGEGTMGQLVNNDTLYHNLEHSSKELELLLEDMRVNPKRYVHFSIFGRKEKPEDKPKKRERD